MVSHKALSFPQLISQPWAVLCLYSFLKSSQDKFSLCCGAEMVDVPASHWSELRKKTKVT